MMGELVELYVESLDARDKEEKRDLDLIYLSLSLREVSLAQAV